MHNDCHNNCLYVGDLTTKHRQALTLFVEKFRKGAIEHGDLVIGKSWTKDMIEEGIDMIFYHIFQLIEVEDHE